MRWLALDPVKGIVGQSKTKAGLLTRLADDGVEGARVRIAPGLYRVGKILVGTEAAMREHGTAWAFDGTRNPNLAPEESFAIPAGEITPGEVEVAVSGWRFEPVLDVRPYRGDRSSVALLLGDRLKGKALQVVGRLYVCDAGRILVARRLSAAPVLVPRPHEAGGARVGA